MATPPTLAELMLPDNNDDPVILSWTKPNLTNENREYFHSYNFTFSYMVFPIMFSQRSKRNLPATRSQTVTLGPDVTSYQYAKSCPHINSLTLCPYSQYCFSVISLYAFNGIHIDASDPAFATICTEPSEAGEFTIYVASYVAS